MLFRRTRRTASGSAVSALCGGLSRKTAAWLILAVFLSSLNNGGAGLPAESEKAWESAQWLQRLAVERLAQKDFREAIPLLEQSLRLNPDSLSGHAWLAYVLHRQRRLDEAGDHYRRVLELEPAAAPDAKQRAAMLKFAPRLFQVSSDPFPLIDAVAVHHPTQPLIAYHFFWQDDIDFPDDNDPCDHELVWVEYDPDADKLTRLATYFHRRILSTPATVEEAAAHHQRPRIDVQWGKHGSLPYGWREIEMEGDEHDIERRYFEQQPVDTLLDYNRTTYRKLHEEGRRLSDHPRTSGWPERFEGSWEDFVRFDREVDILPFLEKGAMAVSRFNSAVLHQNFLAYNFRPKTEWPDDSGLPFDFLSQRERRIGAQMERLMSLSEQEQIRRSAADVSDPFLEELAQSPSEIPLPLPSPGLFLPETPREPNLWFLGPLDRFSSYQDFRDFLKTRFMKAGYREEEVSLNEGADLAFSVEHLQPWGSVRGLRHAHDIHIRFFWNRLLENGKERIEVSTAESAANGSYWLVAASVHYEVEHAHPLHADVEVCPVCGRTGAYAASKGNLVEWVHDPLGLELALRGTIRGEPVRQTSGEPLQGLIEWLAPAELSVILAQPQQSPINTLAQAAVVIHP